MSDEYQKYTFTWKIENFSLESGEGLLSPTFRAESIGGSEWYLHFFPWGDKFVNCVIYRVEINESEEVDFEIQMIGENDEILSSFVEENITVTRFGVKSQFIAVEELNEKMKNWKKDIITINCILKCNSETITHPVSRSEAWTKFGVDRFHFHWNVKLLDSSGLENTYVEQNFRFTFTLVVLSDEIEINIQRLRRVGEDTSKLKVASCKISLISLKGHEIASERDIYFFEGHSTNKWKFPSFISKKMLLDKADELMQENSFTLTCELSVSRGEYSTEFKCRKSADRSSANTLSMDTSITTLLDDLISMFKTKQNSDIKLRVENLTVPAHKFMLVARSPIFRAMFDCDMSENQTGIVNIEDMDAQTLNSFLEYIYTGDVKGLDVENAIPLMFAADKYQVSSLTEKCFVFLKSKLSVENVCDTYTLANTINHELLKSSALEFVENNSARVLSSKLWCDWMKGNVELANEILYKVALDLSH